MGCRNTRTYYGSVAKFFHWWVAMLFLIQIIIGVRMGSISNAMIQWQAYTLHKSIGLLILISMILFILWSLINPKPRWPHNMPWWEYQCENSTYIVVFVISCYATEWLVDVNVSRSSTERILVISMANAGRC